MTSDDRKYNRRILVLNLVCATLVTAMAIMFVALLMRTS